MLCNFSPQYLSLMKELGESVPEKAAPKVAGNKVSFMLIEMGCTD